MVRSGFVHGVLATVVILLGCGQVVEGAESIRVDSVLLALIEEADVPARDSGVVEAIAVREGDLVKTGDTLVQLDTLEVELEVGRAQLEVSIALEESKNDVDVRFAKKSLGVAEAELQRALDSVKDYPKSVSDTELDRLKLTVERTRLEIEQAEHVLSVAELTAHLKQNALETAEGKLARQTIRAPIGGVVVQVYRHHGEWVEPGQQVVRILRLDRLRVEGFVAAALLDATPVGSPVKLLMEGGEESVESLDGKLVYVSPEVDPVNNEVRVWAEVDNPDMRLKPGMRGAMLIKVQASQQTDGEAEHARAEAVSDPVE